MVNMKDKLETLAARYDEIQVRLFLDLLEHDLHVNILHVDRHFLFLSQSNARQSQ